MGCFESELIEQEQGKYVSISKLAFLLALFSFLCAFIIGISQYHDNAMNISPIVNFIAQIYDFEKNNSSNGIMLKSLSIFDIYEENIQKILKRVAILFAILSGAAAVYSSKKETSSFWYSVSIYVATLSLTVVNLLVAGIFLIICFFTIMHVRKWKLSER